MQEVDCLVSRARRLRLRDHEMLTLHTAAQAIQTRHMRHLRIAHKVLVPREKHEHELATHTIVRAVAARDAAQRTHQIRRRKRPLERRLAHLHEALQHSERALLRRHRVALQVMADRTRHVPFRVPLRRNQIRQLAHPVVGRFCILVRAQLVNRRLNLTGMRMEMRHVQMVVGLMLLLPSE